MMKHGYQEKTVRRILRKKIDSWLDSLPEDMRESVAKDVICTGGAPASMLLGEEVKDFDLYFKSPDVCEKVARHYVARFLKHHPDCKIAPEVRVNEQTKRVRIHIQSAGVAGEGGDEGYEYFETIPDEQAANDFLDKANIGDKQAILEPPAKDKAKDKEPYRPRFLSENAISLSDKVQVVIRFTGELDEIHKNYDFEHCKCGYDRAEDKLHTPTSALLSLMSRTLYYTGSLYPLCSLFRMRKFVDRGWHISAGEILKMGFQVSELTLTDPMTLREQLVGVDMAYFHELLKIIEDEKNQREGKPIDASYIGALVDRIFNA
jgi:hypothetical protein